MAASQVSSSPWISGTTSTNTTPNARKAADDAIHRSWRRTSSLARLRRSTRDTAEAISPAATRMTPTNRSGAETVRFPYCSP